MLAAPALCNRCSRSSPGPPLHRSWFATAGHSPGHISFLHRPSGILIAGDALFNVFPSASFASGIEGVLTRPLGFLAGRAARLALGPAQALLTSMLGSRWPVPVPAALNATLASISTERLTSGAVSCLRAGLLTGGVGFSNCTSESVGQWLHAVISGMMGARTLGPFCGKAAERRSAELPALPSLHVGAPSSYPADGSVVWCGGHG